MPITPASPYPKAPGQTIRSTDWNQTVDEVIRLDNTKVNRAGDTITGSLTISGGVGVGVASPAAGNAKVATGLVVGPIGNPPALGRLEVSGGSAELGFLRRTLAAMPASLAAGDRFVWYNSDGNARLFTEVRGDLLTVASDGTVTLTAPLAVPKTAGGNAIFSNATGFTNENAFQPNNLKLQMASTGLIFVGPGQPAFTYEFAIGHAFTSLIIGGGGGTSFVKRFSINQNGDLVCGGSKTGYVVDFFVNAVGEPLEQGDVVVIGSNPDMKFYGAHGDIPVPEVDLTDRPYDHRVCGIVAHFVTEADMPMVDPPQAKSEEEARALAAAQHPFKGMTSSDSGDRRTIADKQLGRMATLGAYAYCKVDADIAPIEAGDLLTTSTTRGHAQKVTDKSQAVGAIIGKALGSLRLGKGKIPVIVTLQ
jgi:hypothetical protein